MLICVAFIEKMREITLQKGNFCVIILKKEVGRVEIISNVDFLKKIKDDPSGNYLFYGEEDYLKSHALKALKDAMGIDETLEIFNYVTLDVLDYDAEKLIDMLSMPPMMAEKKLVVVNGLNIKKMNRGARAQSDEGAPSGVGEFRELLDAIAHLDEFDYNTLVIVLPSGNIDEDVPKKKLPTTLAALAERLTPVKFEASTPQKLALWSARHFDHHKIKAGGDVCAFLVDYAGKNMFTLSSEIEKLSLYAKSQGRDFVTRDDILLICSAEMEYGAFEFSNAILSGRRDEALSILSIMKFKQIEPLIIMGELSGICADLLRIKILMAAGKNQFQIEKETAMNSYKVKLYMNSARNMELEKLQRTVALAVDCDLAMKWQFDAGYLHLEKLICSL